MRYIPFLLVAVFPLAVAGQNIGSAIALVIALTVASRRGLRFSKPQFIDGREISLGCFVLWACLTTYATADVDKSELIALYFAGFLPLLCLPPLLRSYFRPTAVYWQTLFKFCIVVLGLWATIALSQALWGWKLSGSSIQSGVYRAQALYSHPLTFAYTILLCWPMALATVMRAPRSCWSWVLFVSVGVCLWTSESRTVQVIALLLVVSSVFLFLRRSRLLILSLATAVALFATFGDHQLGRKIRDTAAGQADRQSTYPDDRVAFWHAHAYLIQQSPIFGHGVDMRAADREPAYVAIGLESFEKKYPAHNAYLQVAAETGLIGLVLFLWWIGTYLRGAWHRRGSDPTAIIELQTWVAILLAALTQNAFQDSEVRHGILLLCTYAWLRAPSKAALHTRTTNKVTSDHGSSG